MIMSKPSSLRLSNPRIPRVILATVVASVFSTSAFGAWSASGTVKSTAGAALSGVAVTVQDSATLTSTTNATGTFTIGSTTGVVGGSQQKAFSAQVTGGELMVKCPCEGSIEFSLMDAAGTTLWKKGAVASQGQARATLPAELRSGTAFLRVRHSDGLFYQAVTMTPQGLKVAAHLVSARSMATFPILKFKKAGYRDTSYAMTTASATALAIVMRDTGSAPVVTDTSFAEDFRDACTIPTLPAASSLPTIANFPDPFTMMDGTKITTKAQWKCRAEEIGAMLEKYVMGDKMRKPTVTATMSGTKMAIVITAGGKSVTLNVTVTKPSGTGPFPAIIGYGGGNIGGGTSGLAVATINYDNMGVASEGSGRGKGLYYDLYGSSATAGELMAWAWGTSRIIDAIAANPSFGLDAKHIAVTGCSRNGKGAVIAGAMDRRIKLTIPQESGSGGVSAWRLIPVNSASQPISSTASEQSWLRADFPNTFNSAPGKLPFDNHEMIAMVIPNAMLILDNSIAWLGPNNGYGSAVAAKEIFTAMGVPEALTYSSVGEHGHCALPTTQNHWVKSYVQKYLLGGAGEAPNIEAPSAYTFDKAKYVTWTTPTLQ